MSDNNLIAITGGIGGAKLCYGLDQILQPEKLRVIVNTGDDFLYLGFYISPDIDTLIYTLAGVNNKETGWGREDETWKTHNVLGQLGADNWFKLGDKDLALHLHRSKALRNGETLTSITQDIAERFKLKTIILPMSDHMIQTVVETDKGSMPFQEYFVKESNNPKVREISFESKHHETTKEVLEAINDPELTGFLIAPSNPYLSVDPILSIDKIKQTIMQSNKPRVAVSPIIGGDSVKGPTAKIMEEMGLEVSVMTIANHYENLIDGLIIDNTDEEYIQAIESSGIKVKVSNILMNNNDDKTRLAEEAIEFLNELS